jgi:Sulfatase-modifying factor enzyme 1/TIR domain
MRLFVSYARVDKRYCQQIIDLLDMHDVWYDNRLRMGQNWWDEIAGRLYWCEGFIYLLSPDSVASEYCQRELEIANELKKPVFPVLIHKSTKIPENLAQIQYADFSNGLDVTAVKTLLSAIFLAERQLQPVLDTVDTVILPPLPKPPPPKDGSILFDEAVRAFEHCDYDRSVFLIKQIIESGYNSRFIDINSILRQAETALKEQAYLREAQREYAPIATLMKNETTRDMGCTAFRSFRATFPDYDPDNLRQIYDQTIQIQPPFDVENRMPLLSWCRIPSGKVTLERSHVKKTFALDEFFISQYPVTNAQFQMFIDAPDGYRNQAWWQSGVEVRRWHAEHPDPIAAPPDQENYPRANVCWYEAAAFCEWLSFKTGWTIKLPAEQQWQRSAQGDTHWRFPWGNKFDKFRCNCKESEIRKATLVTQYPKSASPLGVQDMLGNVWEWCLNRQAYREENETSVDIMRVVRGGSFMTTYKRMDNNFYYYLNPLFRYQSIGFRIVAEGDVPFKDV